jgi:hypothetical protein
MPRHLDYHPAANQEGVPMNVVKRLETPGREARPHARHAMQYLSGNLVPSIFVFPALGILPWLLGYPMTGSMTIFAGSMTWLATPPEHRDVRGAVQSALFLALASFVLEVTYWRHR